MTSVAAQSSFRIVRIEGRTPGHPGKAPMVSVEDGIETELQNSGSHHEAAYLCAIIAVAEAIRNGEPGLHVESTSEHLVEQMNGSWKKGAVLNRYHEVLTGLAAGLPAGVIWTKI